jgi:hypothetical protein
LISTSILFLSSTISDGESTIRPLFEHNIFSINLENLILPVPEHTTQILSDYGTIFSFYSFVDRDITSSYGLQIENLVFVGYAVIFLSTLAIIRYRQKHVWFWLLICGIFVLMSLGPELKIFNEFTGIVLPDKIFYDTVPEWDEIRAPARFIVMANLALAVLASYAVYGLIKNKFSSFKQQLILTTIIGFVILFEFSMIPYPSYSEPIPDIYEEIKNDESKFAVLPAPLGGVGDYSLMSDPVMSYHQIYHEKPIYGGHESRVSYETLKQTQTYFLNMFHILGSKDDVIKQDLTTHGLSLFDHFDIKYVTIHKKVEGAEFIHDNSRAFLPETRQLMSKILTEDSPSYEDSRMLVYKIPKPDSSEPFLLLGSGWHMFDSKFNLRATMENSEILIVNPTNAEIDVTLNLVLRQYEKKSAMTISINNEELGVAVIPTVMTDVRVENIIAKPGVNVVTLATDEFVQLEIVPAPISSQLGGDWYSVNMGKTGSNDVDNTVLMNTTVSFIVESISITN